MPRTFFPVADNDYSHHPPKKNNVMKALRTTMAALALMAATAAQAQSLPSNAELKASNEYTEIYTSLLRKGTEDDPADVVAVWTKDLQTGKVTRLLTTNPNAPTQWENMKDDNAAQVDFNQVAAADNVDFVPFDSNKIIVEGCPDARNVWSYLIDIRQRTACQLCSSSGLIGFSHEEGYIVMESYTYDFDEGGRMPVIKVFDLNGHLVKKMTLPSAE